MDPLDDNVLPYLAGFFDGEGCVSIHHTNGSPKTFGLTLSINQVDPRPLNLAKAAFGGTIHKIVKKPPHRDIYAWHLNSTKARIFLEEVRPWLIVKADQADIAIAFQTNVEEGGRVRAGNAPMRAIWAKKIKELKHLIFDPQGNGVMFQHG